MKKEKFFDDQPIFRGDLERSQNTKEDAIRERLLDLANPGVIRGSQLLGESSSLALVIGPAVGLYVTLNTGVAISPAGERIVIPSLSTHSAAAPSHTTDNGIGGTTLTPRSTGSENISVYDSATNYIWLGYLETTDDSIYSLSGVTNERLFVKHDDGFEVVVTTSSTNPDSSRFILVGEAVAAGGVVTSVNSANTLEALFVGPITIPGSPYQIALPGLPNLPSDMSVPSSIPDISGFTYQPTLTGAGQFTVDFTAGIVSFYSADSGTTVTINYYAQHTRRQFYVTKANRSGGYVHPVNTPVTYSAGTTVSLTDHINARGAGTITPSNPHGTSASDIGLSGVFDIGAKLASSGIITADGDARMVSSSLSPSAVSAFALSANKVTIAPLVATEAINIEGTLVSASDIPLLTTFDFVDSLGAALPGGTYTFYVNPTTKTIERGTSGTPSGAFPIASIYWDTTKLILPLTDLRKFGTTAKNNIRLETLLGLAAGTATDNRTSTIYNARLMGSAEVVAPNYTFVGLGGKEFTITVDGGAPASVVFAAMPVDTPISAAIAALNTIPGLKAVRTPDNKLKLLAATSLTVGADTAETILGFVAGQTDNEASSFVVTGGSNDKINFKVSAGPELTATLTAGTYVMGLSSAEPGTLCALIKSAMQVVDSTGTYTITFSPLTRKVTFVRSGVATFQILWLTGTNTATAAKTLLGFTNTDTPIATTITSDSTTAAPSYIASNQNIKEIRIAGSTAGIGVAGEVVDAEITFIYDQTALSNLVQVSARIGNSTQTTYLTYNSDSTLRTVTESVS